MLQQHSKLDTCIETIIDEVVSLVNHLKVVALQDGVQVANDRILVVKDLKDLFFISVPDIGEDPGCFQFQVLYELALVVWDCKNLVYQFKHFCFI